jgi:hypothetical protein
MTETVADLDRYRERRYARAAGQVPDPGGVRAFFRVRGVTDQDLVRVLLTPDPDDPPAAS